MFTEEDIIYVYSRKEAVEDGVQVDACIGDFAEVSKQHYPNTPIYMSRELFDLIEKAVKNKKWHNDFKGVWHDILFMGGLARRAMKRHGKDHTNTYFKVIITGTGRTRTHILRVREVATDFDDPRPCLYFSLRNDE